MNIKDRLGLGEKPSVQRLSIYIPNEDKNRVALDDWADWVDAALHLLTEINQGSTSLPPSQSAWTGADGEVRRQQVVVVYSLIRNPDVFEERFDDIIAFLSKFGRNARQQEVMFEFSDGHTALFLKEGEYG